MDKTDMTQFLGQLNAIEMTIAVLIHATASQMTPEDRQVLLRNVMKPLARVDAHPALDPDQPSVSGQLEAMRLSVLRMTVHLRALVERDSRPTP
jgi:hypothetical protein